ncbi:hypothetical protein HaLaN_27601 [Haematococcus lacustris]|uniref:Uncharacterized protein n=1 Tax=Haematococcus lacustris TaxID=44745 RepID=A0A6A0A8S9_HAELA|nr:hypothetical protein HaLaN_27601 [Haematococcus lacustris]
MERVSAPSASRFSLPLAYSWPGRIAVVINVLLGWKKRKGTAKQNRAWQRNDEENGVVISALWNHPSRLLVPSQLLVRHKAKRQKQRQKRERGGKRSVARSSKSRATQFSGAAPPAAGPNALPLTRDRLLAMLRIF